jgi:alpha-beta hydrolase superfamily lysophospholipase
MLAQVGYQVASADLRGHGESSIGWPSITRTDIAGGRAAPRLAVRIRLRRRGHPCRSR